MENPSPTMAVPWWSFTKTVIAAASLVLVGHGSLALDKPTADAAYTLRQLLQHRAGLPDYGALDAYRVAVAAGEEPWPPDVLLARLRSDRLLFTPGQGWRYSNVGYLIVRRELEQATGEPLGPLLERLVLRPLDIAGAWLATSPGDLAGVEMGEAGEYHPGWVYHGLMVGPAESAALLLDRLMNGDLLAKHLLDEMIAPYPVGASIPDRPWTEPGYGLGVMSGTMEGGLRAVGHTGAGPGSVFAAYHVPDGAPPGTGAAFVNGSDEGHAERLALAAAASNGNAACRS